MDAFVTRNGIQIVDQHSRQKESKTDKRFKVEQQQWNDRMEGNARSVLILNTLSNSMEKHKVAAFDLDHTLIVTKSGKRFPQHSKDWKFFHPTLVEETMKQLVRDKYTLVIVSNQLGISQGKSSEKDIKQKIEAICRALDTPILVLLAIRDDRMRKPRPGAWQVIVDEFGVGEDQIDKKSSFYCGDAAGRPVFGNRKKDFAATDYKFAINCGISFQTPEALFLKTKARIHTQPMEWNIGFNPKSLLDQDPNVCFDISRKTSSQEIVVLVGSPASGKSFLAHNHFPDHKIVNQDIEKTIVNCKKRCLDALKRGKSVIIDATNRDPASRKIWIGIGQEQNVSVRCIQIDVSKEIALHLNKYRQLALPGSDTMSQILAPVKNVPDIAIHSFYKSFISPNKEEGFAEVIRVPFCMQSHRMSAIQKLYMCCYLA